MRIALILALAVTSSAFAAFDWTHSTWDTWLKAHTTVQGAVTTVDYKKAKANPATLNDYVKSIEALPKAEFDAANENDRLAFLINAYNALTVKLIVDNYPVKSIKDLGGVFSSPWKKKFFKLFGEERHLDNIEHDMIRKDWNEPRIHFACVCASKGCPQLRGEAFVGAKIDAQLEAQARTFLKDRNRNRFDAATSKLTLSKIFDWYGKDFVKKSGSVQSFVAPRMASTPDEEKAIQKGEVSYFDYDWTLNEGKPSVAVGS